MKLTLWQKNVLYFQRLPVQMAVYGPTAPSPAHKHVKNTGFRHIVHHLKHAYLDARVWRDMLQHQMVSLYSYVCDHQKKSKWKMNKKGNYNTIIIVRKMLFIPTFARIIIQTTTDFHCFYDIKEHACLKIDTTKMSEHVTNNKSISISQNSGRIDDHITRRNGREFVHFTARTTLENTHTRAPRWLQYISLVVTPSPVYFKPI